MRCLGHVLMFAFRWILTFHTVLFRFVVTNCALLILGAGPELRTWPTLLFAVFPILRSTLALVAPLSPGPFFRWRHGYRRPSPREQQQINQVLATFPTSAKRPSRVMIMDGPGVSAFTIGTTVVIERGLLATWLRASLAQQVGCLNATMSEVHLARWWSEYQMLGAIADALDPPQEPGHPTQVGILRRVIGRSARLLSGASRLFNWPERWLYPSLLKRDIYAADRWTASHIGPYDLADFLAAHAQPTDFASPYPWLSACPSAEQRMARLANLGDTQEHR